jgi:hypothetical protein
MLLSITALAVLSLLYGMLWHNQPARRGVEPPDRHAQPSHNRKAPARL